jgi:hypothetical protein
MKNAEGSVGDNTVVSIKAINGSTEIPSRTANSCRFLWSDFGSWTFKVFVAVLGGLNVAAVAV